MASIAQRVHPDEALQRVESVVGPRVENLRLNFNDVDFYCAPDALLDVVRTLHDAPDLRMHFFTFVSAVDLSEFADDPGGLEVVVHLYSPENVIHVTIHVSLDAQKPTCPSLTSIYKGADWHERETAEMFGIHFEGHPRLVNLYLPEDFEGNPLLRAFKIPTRMVKDWPGAKDPEEAAAGGR